MSIGIFHPGCPFRLSTTKQYTSSCLSAIFLHPFHEKSLLVPRRSFARPTSHNLPDFEAISWTPLPQLPAIIQIGFAWRLRLSGRQRQSQR
jgi:hypothetical protein